MTITYAYRNQAYLTLIDGWIEEAHSDLVEFIESLETLHNRLPRGTGFSDVEVR